jgi:hypothetical protein
MIFKKYFLISYSHSKKKSHEENTPFLIPIFYKTSNV